MASDYKKGDEIRVTWQDPQTEAGWFESEEFPPLGNVVTSGIFLKEDENFLWMATTFHFGTGDYADRLTFPKSIIMGIKKLY